MDEEQTTTRGTPRATTWDEAWAHRVEAVESVHGRRVCGARTLSGEPCTLGSDHVTGRCRYHGGTDAIGAPVGNQNARTHGLYARRLQRCGTHCPMWEHCPFAGDDVLALELRDRPICAYEATEYEGLLNEHSAEGGPGFSLPTFSFSKEKVGAHNIALMQVMLSRAASALSVTALTDTTTSESERYQLHTTKMHPALHAFLRISRELRAVQAEYRCDSAGASPSRTGRNVNGGEGEAPADERSSDLADLAKALLAKSEGVMEDALEAETEREEYTRRLEWIVHDRLGADWREFETIREFAVARAKPCPGSPTHDPRFKTQHPPPNEHPPPLRDEAIAENARGP